MQGLIVAVGEATPVNDKWIPLEADSNLEYESHEEVDMDEVLQWKHKCTVVLTCNKG